MTALEAEGHYLLHAPAAKGLLAGLWRWPTVDATALPSQPSAQDLGPVGTRPLRAWPGWTQVYTHRREAVSPLHLCLEQRFTPSEGLRWVPRTELEALPLGKRDLRLRDLLATPGQSPLEAPAPSDLVGLLLAENTGNEQAAVGKGRARNKKTE